MLFVVSKYLYCIIVGIIMSSVVPAVKPERRPGSYTNKAGVEFRVGDRVQLRPKTFKTIDPNPPEFAGRRITQTTIRALFSDIQGGVVLKVRLGGFWSWNVDDLEKVE